MEQTVLEHLVATEETERQLLLAERLSLTPGVEAVAVMSAGVLLELAVLAVVALGNLGQALEPMVAQTRAAAVGAVQQLVSVV